MQGYNYSWQMRREQVLLKCKIDKGGFKKTMEKQKVIITTLKDISYKIETEISESTDKITLENILYLLIDYIQSELLSTRITIFGFISLSIKEKNGNSSTKYIDCKIAESFKHKIKINKKSLEDIYKNNNIQYYIDLNKSAKKMLEELTNKIENSETFSFEQFSYTEEIKNINPREINILNIYNIFLAYTKRHNDIIDLIKKYNYILDNQVQNEQLKTTGKNIFLNILKIIVEEFKNLLLDGWIISLNIGIFEIKYHKGINNYYLSFLNNQHFRNYINQ